MSKLEIQQRILEIKRTNAVRYGLQDTNLTCPKSQTTGAIHTTKSFISGVLQEIPTPEVNQFDLKCFWVDQQVLQLDVPVKYSSLTARVSGLCYLRYDKPGYVLAEEASV